MGRIKSTMIKKTASQLLKESENFNDDFENNKKILGDNMPSKQMRNKIAGQITRLVKQKD